MKDAKRFALRRMALTAAEAGVVTAGGVLEIVIKDAGLAVTKSNFNVGRSSLNYGVSLFYDQPNSPFGETLVDDHVTYL